MKRSRVTLLAAGLAAFVLSRPSARAKFARMKVAARRRARYARGRIEGYVARHCAECERLDLDDGVFADRVRSSLGPLEKQLDIPRVHVTVEHRVAVLHGDVGSQDDAAAIEAAARRVQGVRDVESHLHVGLIAGDTRPSEGGAQVSQGLRHLMDAARGHGGGEETAHAAVAAVLEVIAVLLPEGDRAHVASHLPSDVRAILTPTSRVRPGSIRDVADLYSAVVKSGAIAPEHVPFVVDAVVSTLRTLVPDEAGDVAGVLPAELRAIWQRAVSPGSTTDPSFGTHEISSKS